MYPIIKTINDLIDKVNHKKEISKREADGFTFFVYNYSDNKTFENEYLKECRGILFNKNGEIVSRPLHKFFNLGENEETQEVKIQGKEIYSVFDKLDGSMIATALVDGKVKLRTKSSFNSKEAIMANEYIHNNKNYYDFCNWCALNNITVIFELTSPKNRIVVKYDKMELNLLHLRDNFTGQYLLINNVNNVLDVINKYHIPMVKRQYMSLQDILSNIDNMENQEGYIVQFINGDMVKIKCPWYLNLHRSITFLRRRDVAKLVIDNQIDDLKTIFKSQHMSIKEIEEIESIIVEKINNYQTEIKNTVERFKHLDKKEFAIVNKAHHLFGFIMNEYIGKEYNLLDWYKNKQLDKDFDLEEIKTEIEYEKLEKKQKTKI